MREKFRGTVLGAALGDAIGKCLEDITQEDVLEFYGGRVEGFVPPHPLSPAYGQLPEETSDETTIFKILIESLINRKSLDVRDFLHRLSLWHKDELSHRYPDPILITSIELLSAGVNPSTHGIRSSSVEGILRSVAVGLFHYYNPALAAEGSRLVSLLTHRSDEVSDGAAVLGSAIAYLISEEFNLEDFREKLRFLEALEDTLSTDRFRRVFDRIENLLIESQPLEVAVETLGNGSYVFEALPLALYIFLSNTHTPLEALWQAVNSYGDFGGDTDSVGFITGALVGAYAGVEVFPENLIEDLEDSEYYIELADKLYEITELAKGLV